MTVLFSSQLQSSIVNAGNVEKGCISKNNTLPHTTDKFSVLLTQFICHLIMVWKMTVLWGCFLPDIQHVP